MNASNFLHKANRILPIVDTNEQTIALFTKPSVNARWQNGRRDSFISIIRTRVSGMPRDSILLETRWRNYLREHLNHAPSDKLARNISLTAFKDTEMEGLEVSLKYLWFSSSSFLICKDFHHKNSQLVVAATVGVPQASLLGPLMLLPRALERIFSDFTGHKSRGGTGNKGEIHVRVPDRQSEPEISSIQTQNRRINTRNEREIAKGRRLTAGNDKARIKSEESKVALLLRRVRQLQ